MNWLINLLAALLVVALGAAVVVPTMIDWSQWRGTIEDNAAAFLGVDVAIGGAAEVRLLPSPRLRLGDVRIGPADAPLIEAAAVEVDVAMIPLLSREVRVLDLRLAQPTVNLQIATDGSLAVPGIEGGRGFGGQFDASRIVIDKVAATDMRVTITDDRTGTRRSLAGINVTGSARSLRGPFTAAGTFGLQNVTQHFTVQGAAVAADGSVPVLVKLNSDDSDVAVTFDSALATARRTPVLAGRVAITAGEAWSAKAGLTVDVDHLHVDAAAFALGPAAVPLELVGRASYALGAGEPLVLGLEARQIDLDRILRALDAEPDGGGAVAGGVALDADPANGVPRAAPPLPIVPVRTATTREMVATLVARLAPFVNRLALVRNAGVTVTADLDVGTVVLGGAIVRDVSAVARTATSGIDIERVEAVLPGDASFDASGLLTEAGFTGAVRLQAPQPAVVARWWSGDPIAGIVAPILAEADLDLTTDAVDARRVSLRVGQSVATGRVRWQADGADAGLGIALSAPLVDAADILSLGALVPGSLGSLAAAPLELDLAVDRFLFGETEGSSLTVDAALRDGTLTLNAVAAKNLAGTELFASGTIGDILVAPKGSIAGTIALSDGTQFAAALARLVPASAAARHAATIVPALAPGRLRFEVSGERTPGHQPELAASLSGTAGGTAVDITVNAAPSAPELDATSLTVSATAENADARVLARQFGLAGAGSVAGTGRIRLDAAGTPREGLRGALGIEAPGTALRYEGLLRFDPSPGLSGDVDLSADSLGAVADLIGVRLPDVAAVRLAARLTQPTGDVLRLDELAGSAGNTAVAGALALGSDGISGRLAIDDVRFADLAGLVLGADAVRTTSDGAWPTTGFGRDDLLPVPLSVELAVKRAQAGAISLGNASAVITLSDGRLGLTGLEARLAGGTLTGSTSLQRDGAGASAQADLTLRGASLAALPWRTAGQPAAEGKADLSARFSTAGYSLSGLAAGLAGSGRFTASAGLMRGLNLAPFDLPASVLDAVAPPSDRDAGALLDAHLDRGAGLPFDAIDARVEITDGTLRLADIAIAPPAGLVVEDASFDVPGWTVAASVRLATAPDDDAAAPLSLAFRGPADAPRRIADLAKLATWIALRQLERRVVTVERDNRALEDEADARGAPSTGVLRRLEVPVPPPEPSGVGAPSAGPARNPPGTVGTGDPKLSDGAQRTDVGAGGSGPDRSTATAVPARGRTHPARAVPAGKAPAVTDPSTFGLAFLLQPDTAGAAAIGSLRHSGRLDEAVTQYEAGRAGQLFRQPDIGARYGFRLPPAVATR